MRPPFRDTGQTPARVAWLRAILLSATFFGMLACLPLWTNGREYPIVPIASWFPVIPTPWDKVMFASLLGLLVAACWFYHVAVMLFLGGSLFLVLGDLNRAQPWFYMYWVMLLFSLGPPAASLVACRFVLSAVYVWSGIQKCNPAFFKQVVPWFAYPASKWLPDAWLQPVQWLIAAGPFVEILIGLGLWFGYTRRPAIIAAVAVHIIALLFLGPWGHHINLVVWPWNVAMPALAVVLFWPKRKTSGLQTEMGAASLQGSFLMVVMVALFWLLPILSFWGKWPSYLSFAVYSGNLATADIFVTESFRERVPESLRPFVQPTQQPYNPQIQGPFVFDHHHWAMKELGVPPLPEPRGFLTVGRYLVSKYAAKPSEVRLLIAPRYGPTILYQGSQSWIIATSAR